MKSGSHLVLRMAVVLVLVLTFWGMYGGYWLWRTSSAWAKGKQLYEAGNYVEAARALREFTALNTEDAEGHYWLGNALGFSKKPEEALVERPSVFEAF